MSTLQTTISKSQKIRNLWNHCPRTIGICDNPRQCAIANHYIETIWNPAMDNVEKLVKEAYLAGQQSVLERARGMKIVGTALQDIKKGDLGYINANLTKENELYNQALEDLLSAPLNDTEI